VRVIYLFSSHSIVWTESVAKFDNKFVTLDDAFVIVHRFSHCYAFVNYLSISVFLCAFY